MCEFEAEFAILDDQNFVNEVRIGQSQCDILSPCYSLGLLNYCPKLIQAVRWHTVSSGPIM